MNSLIFLTNLKAICYSGDTSHMCTILNCIFILQPTNANKGIQNGFTSIKILHMNHKKKKKSHSLKIYFTSKYLIFNTHRHSKRTRKARTITTCPVSLIVKKGLKKKNITICSSTKLHNKSPMLKSMQITSKHQKSINRARGTRKQK